MAMNVGLFDRREWKFMAKAVSAIKLFIMVNSSGSETALQSSVLLILFLEKLMGEPEKKLVRFVSNKEICL